MLNRLPQSLRTIWTIALKDIADAVNNKIILSILLGTTFVVLSGLALPWMLELEGTPTAIVYTAEKSALVQGMTARDEFRCRLVNSDQEMQKAVAESPNPVLGLVLPPAFSKEEGSDQVVPVHGLVPHWTRPAKAAELASFFEQALSHASRQTIQIDVEGHKAYPTVDADGQPFVIALNFTLAILMIGVTLAPYLLVEEKETHTLDALLLSPVRLSQVVTGKALAGVFYAMAAAAVVSLFYARAFVHWEIALLAIVLGSSFAVSVGLLIGSLCKNQSAITLWVGILFLGLLAPIFLDRVASSRLPAIVQTAMHYVPSVATSRLLIYAMAGNLESARIWPTVAPLLATSLLMLTLVVWQVRRSDR